MDQFMKAVNDAGISNPDQAKHVVGGVFGLLQGKLNSDDFSKLVAAVPDAEKLASDTNAKAGEDSGATVGGMMSSAMGMFGKNKQETSGTESEGSLDSVTQLVTFLGGLGIKPEQVMMFLPQAAKLVQENANLDVNSVLGMASGSSSSGGASGDLMNQAKGFLGDFGK